MRQFLFILSLLISSFIFTPESYARGCGGCGCNEGLVMNGLREPMKRLAQEAQKRGLRPISCVRTPRCQAHLVSCFNSCGQPGRAARNSYHPKGQACDWPGAQQSRIQRLKSELGMNSIQILRHGAGHGGGMHAQSPTGSGPGPGQYQSPSAYQKLKNRPLPEQRRAARTPFTNVRPDPKPTLMPGTPIPARKRYPAPPAKKPVQPDPPKNYEGP